MNNKAYISMTVLVLLIIISLFSCNILNQLDNQVKITAMNRNKNMIENNIYNNFLEIVEKEDRLEDKILEAFKNKENLSSGEKFEIDNRIFFVSFYKTVDGDVKLKVDEKDDRGKSVVVSYGDIIKDLFKEDLISYEGLSISDREDLDNFISNLSSYESPEIKKYDSIEDPEVLQDSSRIKYIDGNFRIEEDINLEGIIVVNGDIIIEEKANLILAGKLVCKNTNNPAAIDIDRKKEDVLLYYSKYIPGFLDYKAEVIKTY